MAYQSDFNDQRPDKRIEGQPMDIPREALGIDSGYYTISISSSPKRHQHVPSDLRVNSSNELDRFMSASALRDDANEYLYHGPDNYIMPELAQFPSAFANIGSAQLYTQSTQKDSTYGSALSSCHPSWSDTTIEVSA
jgi:hypothetical protein